MHVLARNLNAKTSMIHTKSCKIKLQPNYVNFKQISWMFPILHQINLSATKCKHVSFCLNHGKSWKIWLEICKFMEVFTATSTRFLFFLHFLIRKKTKITTVLTCCFLLICENRWFLSCQVNFLFIRIHYHNVRKMSTFFPCNGHNIVQVVIYSYT